jgi:hypothetical protein
MDTARGQPFPLHQIHFLAGVKGSNWLGHSTDASAATPIPIFEEKAISAASKQPLPHKIAQRQQSQPARRPFCYQHDLRQ